MVCVKSVYCDGASAFGLLIFLIIIMISRIIVLSREMD